MDKIIKNKRDPKLLANCSSGYKISLEKFIGREKLQKVKYLKNDKRFFD